MKFRTLKISYRDRLLLLSGATMMALFTLTRLTLLALTLDELNGGLMQLGEILLAGIVNDLLALVYLLAPVACYVYLVPRRWLVHPWHKWQLLLFGGALLFGLLCLAVAEILFWDEFGARFNFISVDYLVYRREVTGNIAESYPLVPMFTLVGVVVLVSLVLARNWLTRGQGEAMFGARRAGHLALWFLLVVVNVVAVDEPFAAGGDNRYANELELNGVYQFFRAFNVNELDYRNYYLVGDDTRISGKLKALLLNDATRARTGVPYSIARRVEAGSERKKNVMLVVVESLSAKYMGFMGSDLGITPNLDEIAQRSLQFDNLYATGTRTVRGLEAITLSIPPTPGRSIVKRPDNQGLFSIASVFNEKGYDSKFIYGGFGYFDNMNAFFSGNGFKIVDRADFGDDEITFANVWGVADEDLFHKAIAEADKSAARGDPFFQLLMTTSNHRPFTYPEGRIDIPSGSGRHGAVKYTDYAIGMLLAEASQHDWYRDTVFVIVADHTAGSAGKEALHVDGYHIPCLIYAPADLEPRHIGTLASQIDLAPTLFSLLQFDYESRFFGRDLFHAAAGQERALIANYQRLGLLTYDHLVILSPKRQVTVIESPLDSPHAVPPSESQERLEEALAWYQGADYVYHHGLNRDG